MWVPGDTGIFSVLHILRWDELVLCKLGVWFCVGMCECFCGERLKLCLLSVQSC